jgi:LmbE family N-acetylglucosaminyl deacetylase
MQRSQLSNFACRLHKSLAGLGREFDESLLCQRAIVFSPHPDDETLACGGTIARKVQAGADVKVVFMASGNASHSKFMSPQELAKTRRHEALAATSVLGLANQDIVFLDIPDHQIKDQAQSAGKRVRELLHEHRPIQVFIPYRADGPPDHIATNKIVSLALRSCNWPLAVLEYPVWFWNQWPWAFDQPVGRREQLAMAAHALLALGRACTRLTCKTPIIQVKSTKQLAISMYKSQVTRLLHSPTWPVLADVCHGDFLNCFDQDYEYFAMRSMSNRTPSPE